MKLSYQDSSTFFQKISYEEEEKTVSILHFLSAKNRIYQRFSEY